MPHVAYRGYAVRLFLYGRYMCTSRVAVLVATLFFLSLFSRPYGARGSLASTYDL